MFWERFDAPEFSGGPEFADTFWERLEAPEFASVPEFAEMFWDRLEAPEFSGTPELTGAPEFAAGVPKFAATTPEFAAAFAAPEFAGTETFWNALDAPELVNPEASPDVTVAISTVKCQNKNAPSGQFYVET